MNFQDSKFIKGSYKRERTRPNRNWRGGERSRSWRSTQQRHKGQHFSNSRKNFSPNGIYKYGNQFSTHSTSYGVLNQNVQLSVITKKEHIRPRSPFPGSEEYTQRNIEKASDFIKRQLQIDEDVPAKTYINSSHIHENLHSDCNEFPKYTNFENVSSYSANSDKAARSIDSNHYNVVYSPKHSFNTSSHQKIKLQQMYDVNEIHNKLINHISNLSHAKKVNIINQVGPTGYDLAVQQIQKQKRIELSHALREMCKEQCFNEKTDAINSIIPDFDIPIESLPKEIIEKLSTSLDVHFDDSNFSFPNKQMSSNYVEFSRNDFCSPDPIVPETYFRQAETLLKDSLEYLPECKQSKTDIFPQQNLISDTFLQESSALSNNSSSDNLPNFKDFYQPSPQGSDVDQSNFQDDNVALPCPFNMRSDKNITFSDLHHDHRNNINESINFVSTQCGETTKKEYLTVPTIIGEQSQNTSTKSRTHSGCSIGEQVQTISNFNGNIEQNQQEINSQEYENVLQSKLVNAEIKVEDTVEQYVELQPADKMKKDQIKFKSEKIHFEIASRRKLFNKKVCEHTIRSQSKEVDNSTINVNREKFNSTKDTEFLTKDLTKHLQKRVLQSDVETKNLVKGKCSNQGDKINQNNKFQNTSGSNRESDYFAKTNSFETQAEITSTTLMTEQSKNLELVNDIPEQIPKNEDKRFINNARQQIAKVDFQKNKISLNRDSYKETMKIINETDYYTHPSSNLSIKSKDSIGFSCLTKNFNPYTSYLKPTKIPLVQNKEQASKQEHKFLSESNSKKAKEDLAIEEIVKGFSPRKKIQGTAKVRIIKLKSTDESRDLTSNVDKKKSFNKRSEKRKNRRARQKNAMKYFSNELEKELLQTAYNEIENDDKNVKINVPTNTKTADLVNDDKYSDSFSVDFTDTETTAGEKVILASNSQKENIESNYSQSCNDNNKIQSNESTIQSVYEYENEDLDYDYDMFIDINKSAVKGGDLKDDEMVRLWEKRAKDVHNVDEKSVLEDGKLWNNFVEKSAVDVMSTTQDDGLVLATNSKTDNDVTLNFDKVADITPGNLEKNGREEETSSMAFVEHVQTLKEPEFSLLMEGETKDTISKDVQKIPNVENNANLFVSNGIEVDTIKTNNNLIVAEIDLKLDTCLDENEESLKANISHINRLTTFCGDALNEETKCLSKDEPIDKQLNDLKNETTHLKLNSESIEDLEKVTNNIKKNNTLLENSNDCHCISERNVDSKCPDKNYIYENGKHILEHDTFQIKNKHISSDKNSNALETKQEGRSSSRENCKTSNKASKLEICAAKENTADKTSLNKLESSRKRDGTSEESVYSSKEGSTLEQVKSRNKSYHTSDDRKRKIRVRNNYSQTEKYTMKDIELQTENSNKEYSDRMVQCEIDNNIQTISTSTSTANFDSHEINEYSKLTRNDAITKLIEIDKQIGNLLKIRRDFYEVLYDDSYKNIHCKLPNTSNELNTVANKFNNLSVMKSKNVSDHSQLKTNYAKQRKLKKNVKLRDIHKINIGKSNQNINVKGTASLILQDSTVVSKENQCISSNDVEKLNVKNLLEQKKVFFNSTDNLELGKNKILENTTHNNDVNTIKRGHHACNRAQQNANEMEELKTSAKNANITKHSEVTNDNEIITANELPNDNECLVFVTSKSEQEDMSLFLEKRNVASDVCNIKKCYNKKKQIVRDKIQNTEENKIITKHEANRPTKRRKRKHSSFAINNDYVKNLRQTNNKAVTEKPSRKGIVQENVEGIHTENSSVPKCQNLSYTSGANLENEIKHKFSLDEPEHKRRRKSNKTETINIETNVDKVAKESIVEKGSTKGLQREEETVVNYEKYGNRSDLYEEIQKLKCIVRVERLSLVQAGTSAMTVLHNFSTSQNLEECSNSKIENEFQPISQFSEENQYEKSRHATNEVCCDSHLTDLKESKNELNIQPHLGKVNEENFTEVELPKNENNIQSDNLQDLICHNSEVEQHENCMESSQCTENNVDLNCNQEIASKGDSESNILISTTDVGGDLEEILFTNFEGVILVIKVVSGIIIAASDKGKLFCYSMSSGLLLHTINVCSVAITSLCVLKNNDEEILYTGSLDVKLNIYNFMTKEKIKSENVGEPIQCMEYAWDYLFIGSDRGSIIRYDVQKEKVDYKEKIFDLNVLVLRATQEGARKVLVVAARNNPVSVRDAMSGLLMRTMETPFCPTVYTLLLEKNFVFCGTSQHDILVYTFEDGQLIFKHEATKSKGVVCMQIVKNLLFAGCYNGNVYIYNIKTNKHLGTMTGPGGLLLSMEIVNGKIIVGTKSNKFKLWTIPNHYLAENESIT